MTVIKFPGINPNDIPAMLRSLAEHIESGNYGTAVGLVYAFNTEEGDVYCNAFGPLGQLEAIGLYAMAGNMFQCGDFE